MHPIHINTFFLLPINGRIFCTKINLRLVFSLHNAPNVQHLILYIFSCTINKKHFQFTASWIRLFFRKLYRISPELRMSYSKSGWLKKWLTDFERWPCSIALRYIVSIDVKSFIVNIFTSICLSRPVLQFQRAVQCFPIRFRLDFCHRSCDQWPP